MVKKIKHFLICLLLTLFANGNSIADNHTVVELDPTSSGGAKFVKIPKYAAKDFLNGVNSAIVMHNVATQFADGGEFGFGG